MTLELQDVARVMEAAGSPRSRKVAGWSVDTRTQSAGDVFFALRGPNFDGHDFVVPALSSSGALAPPPNWW
jgi:UDP-N-acetylmuramoyl-tripeptide--D-alanyl-D-alanine ligase